MTRSTHERLLADFSSGRTAALARAISIVENHRAGFEELLATWHPRLGHARRIGVTGPPGAGKSTLTTGLARAYRAEGLTVGIIAVDPTSPFTGGALLGDRIRMATRGSLGGLSAAAREACDVLDAFGIDRILIETVGVGQSELDVARTADTSLVVLVPESGDSIQTLKAGLMEIADIFAVNKADRPGADRLRNEIEVMLGMRAGATMRNVPAHHGVDLSANNIIKQVRAASATDDVERWTPPVLRTVAVKDEGIPELVAALDRHFRYLEESGTLRTRRRTRLRERVVEVVEAKARRRLWNDAATNQWLEDRLPELEAGTATPFAIANDLLGRSADLLTRTQS
jgi:LAO/AO transport system kinase